MTFDYACYDFVGKIVVLCIVGSYFAPHVDWLYNPALAHRLSNGVGALALMISLSFDFNLSSMIIECFWLAISAVGFVRWWRRHRAREVDTD